MKHLTVFLCLAGAAAIALAVSAPVAEANDLECGAEIWEDTKLTEDLDCTDLAPSFPPPSALHIRGSNVTLDLGGHTIFGPEGRCTGVAVKESDGVTIKNGTIRGFDIGVAGDLFSATRDLEVKDLVFIDQDRFGVTAPWSIGVVIKDSTFIGPEIAIEVANSEYVSIKNIDATNCYHGVWAENSTKVEIKDSTIHNDGEPFDEAGDAIVINNVSYVQVKNVDIFGHVWGVKFVCWGCVDDFPNKGVVSDNTFAGCFAGGIEITDYTDVKILGNHISDTLGGGITVARVSVGVSNLAVKNNHIHDNDGHGMLLLGLTDSVVSDNHVWRNGYFGISLLTEIDSSTDNRIISNTTFGNGWSDLAHDEFSTPNIWEDNSWDTCWGSDIPGCPNW